VWINISAWTVIDLGTTTITSLAPGVAKGEMPPRAVRTRWSAAAAFIQHSLAMVLSYAALERRIAALSGVRLMTDPA
jgi:hypothetical protein